MKEILIAPCGMNCALCYAFIREKNRCEGCLVQTEQKSNHCKNCSIKNCEMHTGADSILCHVCPKFPCARIRKLDLRYRTKYHMSMIENLEYIRSRGMEAFLENEKTRWACSSCGSIITVHRENCPTCDSQITFALEAKC